jgi:prepilin-type N-terminal cleavage/methylation domain-containing protein
MNKIISCKRFTLVELLVVIAILGILLSLLLPSLSRVKEITLESVCMSNRSQNMTGVVLYSKNKDSSFPASKGRPWRLEYTIKNGSYHLMGRVITYVGDEVMGCPKINYAGFTGSINTRRGNVRRWLSYNCAIWRHRRNNIPQTFHNTEEKAILGDLVQNAGTLGSDHKRKVKMLAYIDGSVKKLVENQLKAMKSLQGIPSKNKYRPFWNSMNELD